MYASLKRTLNRSRKRTPAARSNVMSRIRGHGNRSTEVRFRMSLASRGITGWTLHPKHILGRPDFFFPKKGLAVFVDGCFWHGCITCYKRPKTNRAFWKEKIRINRFRDRRISSALKREGIQVIRIWEHELARSLTQSIDAIARVAGCSRRKS
jgi:DNA mismatch endonuclease Vsr